MKLLRSTRSTRHMNMNVVHKAKGSVQKKNPKISLFLQEKMIAMGHFPKLKNKNKTIQPIQYELTYDFYTDHREPYCRTNLRAKDKEILENVRFAVCPPIMIGTSTYMPCHMCDDLLCLSKKATVVHAHRTANSQGGTCHPKNRDAFTCVTCNMETGENNSMDVLQRRFPSVAGPKNVSVLKQSYILCHFYNELEQDSSVPNVKRLLDSINENELYQYFEKTFLSTHLGGQCMYGGVVDQETVQAIKAELFSDAEKLVSNKFSRHAKNMMTKEAFERIELKKRENKLEEDRKALDVLVRAHIHRRG